MRWVMIVIGVVLAVAILGLMVYLHTSGTLGPGIHGGGTP